MTFHSHYFGYPKIQYIFWHWTVKSGHLDTPFGVSLQFSKCATEGIKEDTMSNKILQVIQKS